jgi:PncC family amidohydrolase
MRAAGHRATWKGPVLIDRLNLADLAERALATARRRNLTIVTAESCTAGKLSALLSEASGAAEHLHGSFVTYTKANKVKALGVDPGLLKAKGAVCREVAVAMAEGALHRSPADVAVAITGVAGPDPDEDGNPRRSGLHCRGARRTCASARRTKTRRYRTREGAGAGHGRSACRTDPLPGSRLNQELVNTAVQHAAHAPSVLSRMSVAASDCGPVRRKLEFRDG